MVNKSLINYRLNLLEEMDKTSKPWQAQPENWPAVKLVVEHPHQEDLQMLNIKQAEDHQVPVRDSKTEIIFDNLNVL